MGLRQLKPQIVKSRLSKLSANNRYQYSPLSDTYNSRLLRIQPGCKHDGIKCSLSPLSFASKPAYKALSYTWGTNTKTHTIECDGKLLPVTANLYSALQRFREKKKICTIWVDAICIDQDNIPERNRQVQNMRRIYASAREVVIWLGDEIKTDSEAFAFINTFEKAYQRKQGFDWDAPGTFFSLHGVNHNTVWKSLGALLQRPWFRRLWIIQEVVVASNVRLFCGSQTCTWESISKMILIIRQHNFHFLIGNYSVGLNTVAVMALLKESFRQNRLAELNYLGLLEDTQSFVSTDPRDRFFALHGFLSNENTDGIQIDYSLSCEQVYHQWAMHSIVNEESLKLLSSIERSPNSELDLPSWIPDWSSAPEQTTRNTLSGMGFKATGEITAKASVLEDGRVLKLVGLKVDIIQRVGSLVLGSQKREPLEGNWLEYESVRRLLRDEIEWYEECDDIASTSQPYPNGEDFPEAYARLMVCNQKLIPEDFENPQGDVEDSQDDPDGSFFREGYQIYRQVLDELVKSRETFEGVSETLNLETLLQYTNGLNSVTVGRKFCATERRYLGWVPRDAAPGDIICIFFGSETPHILRPDENDRNYYKLIGETYIHGIMQGEALKWDDISPQEFKIR